jgi:hypothetical protein
MRNLYEELKIAILESETMEELDKNLDAYYQLRKRLEEREVEKKKYVVSA